MVARLVTRNCHCHEARSSHSLAYIQTRTRVRLHTYELILRFRFTVMHCIYRHDIVAVDTANHVRGMRRTRRVRSVVQIIFM